MAAKITYATLGGEALDDLHRALDEAIAKAPETFGREHLLSINGRFVRAETQFDDRSPIDTSILLGRFQQGTRDHVRAAVAAARAAGMLVVAVPDPGMDRAQYGDADVVVPSLAAVDLEALLAG